jgi:predicted Rossmann fold nucleotide-binding protein DprA/Smf involved in DNA uptake
MVIAIIGSRNFDDYAFMKRKASEVIKGLDNVTGVVSGGAKGADSYSERLATDFGLTHKHFKADWAKYGRAAGPIRNKLIVDTADIIIAFPIGESKGTRNAIDQAVKAGKKVFVFATPSPK